MTNIIDILISQFFHIRAITISSDSPVDRCRKIAKQSREYQKVLTRDDEISMAIRDEFELITVRALVGTINRVERRANEALTDIRQRTDAIIEILQEWNE